MVLRTQAPGRQPSAVSTVPAFGAPVRILPNVEVNTARSMSCGPRSHISRGRLQGRRAECESPGKGKGPRHYRNLDAWEAAMEAAIACYELARRCRRWSGWSWPRRCGGPPSRCRRTSRRDIPTALTRCYAIQERARFPWRTRDADRTGTAPVVLLRGRHSACTRAARESRTVDPRPASFAEPEDSHARHRVAGLLRRSGLRLLGRFGRGGFSAGICLSRAFAIVSGRSRPATLYWPGFTLLYLLIDHRA